MCIYPSEVGVAGFGGNNFNVLLFHSEWIFPQNFLAGYFLIFKINKQVLKLDTSGVKGFVFPSVGTLSPTCL